MKRVLTYTPRILNQVGKFHTGQIRNGFNTLLSRELSQNGQRILSSNHSTFSKFNNTKHNTKDQSTLNLSTSAQPEIENPLAGAIVEGSLKEAVEVRWQNGEVTHYPYLWLRDNCYCPKCKKQGRDVFQRDFLMQDLNPNSAPKDVKV